MSWEIERTFSILKEILGMEYIRYVKHRNYDVSIGEIIEIMKNLIGYG